MNIPAFNYGWLTVLIPFESNEKKQQSNELAAFYLTNAYET